MAECQSPKVILVMLGPTKVGVDHHRTRGSYEVLDYVLRDVVVVMSTEAAVVDFLTL